MLHSIHLQDIEKRFNQGYLFKHLNISVETNKVCAITGINGSGKSTLLQIISGYITPDRGSVHYMLHQQVFKGDHIGLQISLVAPYTTLFETLNLKESIDFHFTHKRVLNGYLKTDLLNLLGLEKHRNKALKDFSSGMFQKVKLGLALYSETPILLLDEPTSNLDEHNKNWFFTHLERVRKNRIVVIASNEKEEIAVASQIIHLS